MSNVALKRRRFPRKTRRDIPPMPALPVDSADKAQQEKTAAIRDVQPAGQ
jgi:hypothetical protein